MQLQPIYLLFEFLSYTLFAACLWHAFKHSTFRAAELGASLLYGVILEWLTLHQLGAYHYGQFLVMFDGTPLTIGVGWSVIIYSAMELSDSLDLPEIVKPWLDTLLALNIDLAMDTIAIRLGMWRWGNTPFDQQWFGVPWVNFWAWFIVVLTFSASIRALRVWRRHRIRRWLYVPASLLLPLFILAVTNRTYSTLIVPAGIDLPGILLLVGCGMFVVYQARPRVLPSGPPTLIVIAVPLTFHLLYIIAGVHYGFYAETPILAVIGLTMLFAGTAIHLWPWWVWHRNNA